MKSGAETTHHRLMQIALKKLTFYFIFPTAILLLNFNNLKFKYYNFQLKNEY